MPHSGPTCAYCTPTPAGYHSMVFTNVQKQIKSQLGTSAYFFVFLVPLPVCLPLPFPFPPLPPFAIPSPMGSSSSEESSSEESDSTARRACSAAPASRSRRSAADTSVESSQEFCAMGTRRHGSQTEVTNFQRGKRYAFILFRTLCEGLRVDQRLEQ